MRDVGFLIWIALLFIGVIGSIVSSVRKQMQRSGSQITARPQLPQPAAPPRPAPVPTFASRAPEPSELPQWLERMLEAPAPQPAALSRPLPAKPAPRPVAPSPASTLPHAEHRITKAPRLFGSQRDLVRAVIAAEVLGKPRGLIDEYPFR